MRSAALVAALSAALAVLLLAAGGAAAQTNALYDDADTDTDGGGNSTVCETYGDRNAGVQKPAVSGSGATIAAALAYVVVVAGFVYLAHLKLGGHPLVTKGGGPPLTTPKERAAQILTGVLNDEGQHRFAGVKKYLMAEHALHGALGPCFEGCPPLEAGRSTLTEGFALLLQLGLSFCATLVFSELDPGLNYQEQVCITGDNVTVAHTGNDQGVPKFSKTVPASVAVLVVSRVFTFALSYMHDAAYRAGREGLGAALAAGMAAVVCAGSIVTRELVSGDPAIQLYFSVFTTVVLADWMFLSNLVNWARFRVGTRVFAGRELSPEAASERRKREEKKGRASSDKDTASRGLLDGDAAAAAAAVPADLEAPAEAREHPR